VQKRGGIQKHFSHYVQINMILMFWKSMVCLYLKVGVFLTIQDKTIDKGKAVRFVIHLFAKQWKQMPLSIGIGDSLNDIPMLTVVDKPFLVQKPDKTWVDFKFDDLTKLNKIGPEGFLEMTSLLYSDVNE
jgi:predicted mannosyl-3-phosphoglycerate phosphatase (HAD superfamily)